jgi:hypothetical protein
MQRRKQQPIAIRSDRAAARLRVLTRKGRSQAAVIEEALDRMPDPDSAPTETEIEARRARLAALIGSARDIPSMAEFDAREYDERGNPR